LVTIRRNRCWVFPPELLENAIQLQRVVSKRCYFGQFLILASDTMIKKLGLPPSVDFRSFRTMHSSLMSSIGVRPEVTRDNMGHATVDVTQNIYNRTWWEERVEAVSMAAATVWREFLAQPVPATRM
jgi:integrase